VAEARELEEQEREVKMYARNAKRLAERLRDERESEGGSRIAR